MPAERFFLDHALKAHEKILIEDEEAKHLRVMRANPGDTIEIVNGRGQLGRAKILGIGKDSVEALLGDIHMAPSQEGPILCIGVPKMNRLEWIIEKGTELGVAAFRLFPGDLSEKTTFSDHQKHRLRNLSIAALKQCGRLDLPPIEIEPPLAKWKRPNGTLLFGDTDPKAPRIAPPYPAPVFFFSGPEKGFSDHEHQHLRGWQAQGISLHRNILRADTAPIAAAVFLGI